MSIECNLFGFVANRTTNRFSIKMFLALDECDLFEFIKIKIHSMAYDACYENMRIYIVVVYLVFLICMCDVRTWNQITSQLLKCPSEHNIEKCLKSIFPEIIFDMNFHLKWQFIWPTNSEMMTLLRRGKHEQSFHSPANRNESPSKEMILILEVHFNFHSLTT